jgi:colanic acid biosynthesis glycosyl transferase WcaI
VVVKDVMPDAAIELGMLRNRAMIRFSRWMARQLYAGAAEILTLGEGMRRRIAQFCARPERVRIVTDTVDGRELYPEPFATNEFRRQFVRPGQFAVLHTGNMGKKQDLHLILRAAELLRNDSHVQFFVFGDGAVKDEFLAERDRRQLRNVSHFPLQERSLLRHMLSGADLVLVSQLREVVDIVVPSKLLTSMISGAMIVAACSPGSEPERILAEDNAGIVIPAEDEFALVRAIQDIRARRVDVEGFRARAREYAMRTFDRDAAYGPVATFLRERIGMRSQSSHIRRDSGRVPVHQWEVTQQEKAS